MELGGAGKILSSGRSSLPGLSVDHLTVRPDPLVNRVARQAGQPVPFDSPKIATDASRHDSEEVALKIRSQA
jgi:hypothetical protein